MKNNKKNNNIKKVALFTIRDIEKSVLFKDITPQKNTQLINYFISLPELKKWLNDQVSDLEEDLPSLNENENDFDSIKRAWEGQKEELKTCFDLISKAFSDDDLIAGPIQSLPEKIDNAKNSEELKRCKDDYNLAIGENTFVDEGITSAHEKILSFFDNIKDNHQDTNKGKKCFSESHYDNLKEYVLRSEKTYCDKWDGEVKVKHRLGMYYKNEVITIDSETIGYAVCAIFPWMGDYEDNHDESWTQMLVGSVLEFYPNVETIILVCHDMDFKLYAEKDFVVSRNINEDNKYTRKYTARIIEIPLVVFQHSHSEITSTLSKSSAKDVYTSMDNFVSGFVEMQNSDTDKKNAMAHKEKYKS